MDESLRSQNRRHRRSNVMLKATLETPGGPLTVILRNLSQEGALVKGDPLPGAGTAVLFHRDGLSVPSKVAWSHAGHAGIAFDSPLFPREMLRHVPPPERKQPAGFKRPGFSAKPLTEAERSLIEMWAVNASTVGD